MADCEQCAVLQRQNDFLANDRDGYVQLLTNDNNKLRAEVERLNKSRNKWGQKYNKLLEKHKVTVSQLKAAVWSDSEECKLLTAEVERLMSVAERVYQDSDQQHIIELARAAITQGKREG